MLTFKSPQGEDAYWFERQALRMAIPGSQPKYSLMLEDDELTLTREGIKGLFLLKMPPASAAQHAQAITENEHLTLQIAANVFDIDTVKNAIIYYQDDVQGLLLRRFDIDPEFVSYQQEDFYQLREKQVKGVPQTYEDMGALIKKHIAAYGPALAIFFKRILFNYLVSNGSGGPRSFSIKRTEHGDYALTPAYGLSCTRLLDAGSKDMAMELYEGVHKSSYYQKFKACGQAEFVNFARRLGLTAGRAETIIASMTDKEYEVADWVEKSFLSGSLKKEYLRLFKEKLHHLRSTYP
ncbi:HipA domain-containing protein [Chitinophaga horti]|uniref:HipA domain-containing protein n=1 Tax=Chitinophaga horti TaxID=2920382 RepID=A0ABY6IYB5_9BACT|nr:HipA domain-containing protein [Chitinophaga horti]UYQ92388.1 HipA domain-containing protein [Chitinophaga horti]